MCGGNDEWGHVRSSESDIYRGSADNNEVHCNDRRQWQPARPPVSDAAGHWQDSCPSGTPTQNCRTFATNGINGCPPVSHTASARNTSNISGSQKAWLPPASNKRNSAAAARKTANGMTSKAPRKRSANGIAPLLSKPAKRPRVKVCLKCCTPCALPPAQLISPLNQQSNLNIPFGKRANIFYRKQFSLQFLKRGPASTRNVWFCPMHGLMVLCVEHCRTVQRQALRQHCSWTHSSGTESKSGGLSMGGGGLESSPTMIGPRVNTGADSSAALLPVDWILLVLLSPSSATGKEAALSYTRFACHGSTKG